MKNHVHVRICNRVYSMLTDESDMYTAQLSNELSDRIEATAKQSSLALVDAAILTALELLDNIKKDSCNTDSIRSQINEYIKAANEAKNQAEQLNVIIDQNDAVIQKLQEENNQLKKQAAVNDALLQKQQTDMAQLAEQLNLAQSTIVSQQEDIKNLSDYAGKKEQENNQLAEYIRQIQTPAVQPAEQSVGSETAKVSENTAAAKTSKTKNSRKK